MFYWLLCLFVGMYGDHGINDLFDETQPTNINDYINDSSSSEGDDQLPLPAIFNPADNSLPDPLSIAIPFIPDSLSQPSDNPLEMPDIIVPYGGAALSQAMIDEREMAMDEEMDMDEQDNMDVDSTSSSSKQEEQWDEWLSSLEINAQDIFRVSLTTHVHSTNKHTVRVTIQFNWPKRPLPFIQGVEECSLHDCTCPDRA